MRTLLSLLLVAAVALATSINDGKVTYHGQQVLRVTVENQHQFNLLSEMRGQLNFWHEPAVGRFADIQVSKDSTLPAKLTALGLSYTVYVEDVQALIDGSFESIEKRKLEFEAGESKATIDLDSYHRLDAIYSWFDDLASENDFIEVETIGDSFEGRELRVLRICKGVSSCAASTKPIMFLDAGIHAREWVGPATVLYLIDFLTQNVPSGDEDLTDNLDWYFLPVVNPDGYEYTWTNDRLWRRTRSIIPGDICIGVDANRNYGYHFDEGGASDGGCSDTYHGPFPFSEQEIEFQTDYIEGLGSRVVYYQNFHSYSQLIMYPWGYSETAPNPDAGDMDRVAAKANAALFAQSGEDYELGDIANTIYVASGGAVDYTYGALGIKYSYTIELRDKGRYGFILPESLIRPTADEMYAFHASFARDMIEEFGKK